MQFRTEVDIAKADFEIQPAERMLFVGSCPPSELLRAEDGNAGATD